jgi:acylphosphatase
VGGLQLTANRALKLKVLGRVQGVGYRRFLLDTALEEGVAGYAKNEKDGSVSVFAQGDAAKMVRFVKAARSPPSPVLVREVKEVPSRLLPNLKHFGIKFGSFAEELQEGFGAIQSEFNDYRQEFRDYKDEFRDYRDEFRDYRQEFRDYREEFRGFAARTDGNFKELGQKYGEISEKLTRIMDALMEESKKSREMLEAMRQESKEGRETLAESLRLLREAVDRLPSRQ